VGTIHEAAEKCGPRKKGVSQALYPKKEALGLGKNHEGMKNAGHGENPVGIPLSGTGKGLRRVSEG